MAAGAAISKKRAGRLPAVATLVAVILHVLVAAAHLHDLVFAGIMLVMALVCSSCSIRCWLRPSRGQVVVLLVMAALMLLLHIGWMLWGGGGAMMAPAMPATISPTMSGMTDHAMHGHQMASGMWWALAITGVAELAVMACCGYALRQFATTKQALH